MDGGDDQMGGYLQIQTAVAAGRRPAALLGLLVAAGFLMSVPALVAVVSILDANLPSGGHDWASGMSAWISFLAHARVVLYVPLLAMVARARENL